MVFEDANWDVRKFNLEQDTKLADQKMAGILNATDPDLHPFKKRGGKLIMYHGWSDAAISPVNSIQYYESVSPGKEGRDQRLYEGFHGPGLQHCFMGPGPNRLDRSQAARKATRSTMCQCGGTVGGKRGGPQKDIATKDENDLDPVRASK